MADSDDDTPPPLASLPDQIEALRLLNEGPGGAVASSTPIASTIIKESKKAAPKAPVIRKGFFDAKPKVPSSTQKLKAAGQSEVVDEVIDLTGLKVQPQVVGEGRPVPGFMMIPPDEAAVKYAQYKAELLDVLKPTEDTVNDVVKDPVLVAGFDDPEVMQAVNDIAANPQNFKKYQKNEKVMRFYMSMGKMMGSKLDKAGAAAPVPPK